MQPDLGYIFYKVKAYLDAGYSFSYAASLAGIKKHRLASLIATCPQLKQIRDEYVRKKGHKKWP